MSNFLSILGEIVSGWDIDYFSDTCPYWFKYDMKMWSHSDIYIGIYKKKKKFLCRNPHCWAWEKIPDIQFAKWQYCGKIRKNGEKGITKFVNINNIPTENHNVEHGSLFEIVF